MSFDQFITDLTAGNADLIEMRASQKPGKSADKSKQVRRNAKVATTRKVTTMSHSEKAATAVEAFNSENAGLYDFLRGATWSDFAQSLADGIAKYGSLTDKQMSAAVSMRLKVEGNADAAPKAKASYVGGFGEVVALMDHIQASGAKFPRVRVQTKGGEDFIITRKMSGKFAGTESINLGTSVQGPWLGGISTSGNWTPSRIAGDLDQATKADLWETMQELQRDPKAVFARNGKKLGRCVCCGKPLSDQTSVNRGVGPECWGKL